jgi:acetylornithine deacetylase/succinyl-diaminopimelate desuccinylase-like protein
METVLTDLQKLYQEGSEEALRDFFTFLKFNSISSEESYSAEVHSCATWLASYIEAMGFSVEIWPTSGHPVIFASYCGAGEDKPTLLIYNHYDVQPVDPLDLWQTPPFSPTIRSDQVYARGAQDNKGQCFYVLQALKLLLRRDGKLPINIKLCIEGEEECGSKGLAEILAKHKRALQADTLAIVDVGLQKADQPAVTIGLRGLVTMDVSVKGTKGDLHSGMHGGLAYNPIRALTELLSGLYHPDGRVAVNGFYDAVLMPSEKEKESLALEFDEESYLTTYGALPTGGEKSLKPLERAWLRPTLEINGIAGGYSGTGFKTVIPAEASAKISCRLVPHQDPMQIGDLVKQHLIKNCPPGIKVEVNIHKGCGTAVRTNIDSRSVKAFAQSYSEVFGKSCTFILEGASIPIATELAKTSESELVLVGLGLGTDNIHAPNEHFGLDRLEKGALIIARAIELLNT